MAHPLHWPSKYFFYPIGNTSAICLTRDIEPRTSASILLLGCGDPRNVLYTIYCERATVPRGLDFTCCDFDPGVLARNVLLFTLLIDKKPPGTIWNIFFHMYLDEESNAMLVSQCWMLAELARSHATWRESVYGAVIKMCTEQTLDELRRYWILYAEMQSLPSSRFQVLASTFKTHCSSVLSMSTTNMGPARSAGPFMPKAFELSKEIHRKYWKTGTIITEPKKLAAATVLNPTFVYSRGENACCVHYGTDPTTPFHLAAAYGNAKRSPTAADIIKAAMAQFGVWCSAFQTLISSSDARPVIRFFWGDAAAACHCILSYHLSHKIELRIPVAQWKTQTIQLSRDEYTTSRAPSQFDVIETSNLVDHIGLLNIIIAATPLLASPSSVLYTESLVYRGEDATRELHQLLFSDITTFALLVGLCPVDYLTGFTSRSNTHEVMAYEVFKGNAPQYQQVITWRTPSSAEMLSSSWTFDGRQLGTFLYDLYHAMFEHEDSRTFFRKNWDKDSDNFLRAVGSSNLDHYTRESFVLLLKLVKSRLGMKDEAWTEVMDWFFGIHSADHSMPMDRNNSHDLWIHLHRHGLYTVSYYHHTSLRNGRFSSWATVPVLIRVILVVPRERLTAVGSIRDIGTPPMNCVVTGKWTNNIFSSVHVAFGRVIPLGSPASPQVRFEEDSHGWKGSSPLVASFIMPSALLTRLEDPSNLHVCLCFRSTAASTPQLFPTLGPTLSIYDVPLMDSSRVHILPEAPLPSPIQPPSSIYNTARNLFSEIGESSTSSVEFDDDCEFVRFMTVRISVKNRSAVSLLQSGTNPEITQLSPHVMRVSLGTCKQDVGFPFPVLGSQAKLRLARKSLYIEVVVPPSHGLKPDGMRLNRFPIVRASGDGHPLLYPWNIHRVNFSVLPAFNIQLKAMRKWLKIHFGSTFSTTELSLIKKTSVPEADAFTFVKENVYTLFERATATADGPPARVFSLVDPETNNSDSIILVNSVRFDLPCHTFVCDAFFVPLTKEVIGRHEQAFNLLVRPSGLVPLGARNGAITVWKKLIPAFVERCRSQWEHGPNCEYVAQGRTPLSEEMEETPICSCGSGKDVDGMQKDPLWRVFAPYATRVAISPFFAVTYLEKIGRDPEAHRCALCRGKGKPKLQQCTGCKKIKYCSRECQAQDWKAHKAKCKV
ncbi:hypothetical protein K488DRAFT_48122 [Vararia minispora EC-137]|uniref:Uncharacterized protein n=1 Tax=Vararia minispora EC-137 TaxID=1314806 RepID=A0ACB8QNB1_9AGAM|nr:hypothetical protein K488DRAFT_48122 [Vararia minispora EC-137]